MIIKSYFLFAHCKSFPHHNGVKDHGHILITTGFSDTEIKKRSFPDSKLNYGMAVCVKAKDIEEAKKIFERDFKISAKRKSYTELITCEEKYFRNTLKDSFKILSKNDSLFRVPLLLFKKNSNRAKKEVKKFIVDCLLKKSFLKKSNV